MAPELVEEVLKTIDCYVMGSRTYETALDFEIKGLGWSYGAKPTFVLTSRELRKTRDTVEFYSGDLALLMNERLKPNFRSIWFDGGGEVSGECLRLGPADEVSGSSQGPDVGTKFLCELGERQELVLMLVTHHGFGRAVEHGGRNRSTSAVPGAQRLEWDRQQLGKFALTESCRSAQLAKRVHPAHTMVFVASPSQATSGISGQ
jgi:dihydrofolate reductase